MRLGAVAHALQIGRESGFDAKAWVPHVLREFGQFSDTDIARFYPQGTILVSAPAPTCVPAGCSETG